ncbi:hypothetical protein AB8Y31_15280 [Listeria monocytogenes]|uniref:hypothetical protein n=1 Tax=Listeria monocytogenes TaxID=1639 RepID=UPI00350E5678
MILQHNKEAELFHYFVCCWPPVMGITALLFSVTSNLTNYYSYRYNAVTVTNKKMRSVTIFQQTDS